MTRASAVRCCGGKGSIPRISLNGARPGIRARRAGSRKSLAGRPGRSAAEAENERLRKENEKLAAELARTKAALDVVGKAHALLELLSESADSDAKRQK